MRLKGFYKLSFTNLASTMLTLGLFACSSRPTTAEQDYSEYDSAATQVMGEGMDSTTVGSESTTDEAFAPTVEEAQAAATEGQEAAVAESVESSIQDDAGFEVADANEISSAPVVRSSSSWSARPVVVEAKPFQHGEFAMNSFYFVRSDSENWKSISTAIYGRPDRSNLLKSWNAQIAGLKAGQVLYYNSPSRPEDRNQMKPFALDFGAELNQIQVQAGDTLSGLAQKHYGKFESWKEISALNPQLTNPDQIEVGQSLYLQPAQVDTAAYLAALVSQVEQVAKVETPPPAEDNFEDSMSESADATAPPAMEVADEVPAPTEDLPPPAKAPRAAPAIEAKLDPSEFYMRVGVSLIAIAVLALVFTRVRRRKAEQRAAATADVHDFPRTGT